MSGYPSIGGDEYKRLSAGPLDTVLFLDIAVWVNEGGGRLDDFQFPKYVRLVVSGQGSLTVRSLEGPPFGLTLPAQVPEESLGPIEESNSRFGGSSNGDHVAPCYPALRFETTDDGPGDGREVLHVLAVSDVVDERHQVGPYGVITAYPPQAGEQEEHVGVDGQGAHAKPMRLPLSLVHLQ